MNIGSTSFQHPLPPCFHTFSLSAQYSNAPPVRMGAQTRSPVSLSVSAENHRGLCGGSLPSSLAFLVARCRSSCLVLKSLASSYCPFSNAFWSGRSRQSVGQMYGRIVSSGQSFKVMANGVRLNGAGGFSEFLQRRMYSREAEGELRPPTVISGWREPLPVPTARATSWLFQRPAISYLILPDASSTLPAISNASFPRHPLGLKVKRHWSPVRWFLI